MDKPIPIDHATEGCVDPDVGMLLAAYDWGLLSNEDADRFEYHLVHCTACAAELERLWNTSAGIRSVRRQRTRWVPVGVAAAAAALLLFLELGGHNGSVQMTGSPDHDTLGIETPAEQATFTFHLETTPEEGFTFDLNVPETS